MTFYPLLFLNILPTHYVIELGRSASNIAFSNIHGNLGWPQHTSHSIAGTKYHLCMILENIHQSFGWQQHTLYASRVRNISPQDTWKCFISLHFTIFKCRLGLDHADGRIWWVGGNFDSNLTVENTNLAIAC